MTHPKTGQLREYLRAVYAPMPATDAECRAALAALRRAERLPDVVAYKAKASSR